MLFSNRILLITAMIFMTICASIAGEPLLVHLVDVDADKKVIVPLDDVDDAWRYEVNFLDTAWTDCIGAPGGIGFDNEGGYNDYITLNVGHQMGRTNSCFIRTVFYVDQADLNELDYLSIKVFYDDGFAAYINGTKVASANAPDWPGRWSTATQPHEAQIFNTFDISQFIDQLQPGKNVLALHGMNVASSSGDYITSFSLQGRKNYKNNFVSNLPIAILESTNGGQTSLKIIAQENDVNSLSSPSTNYEISLTKLASQYDYKKFDYTLKSDTDISILGKPANTEWKLMGPYSDKSLLRDYVMASFGHLFGRLASKPALVHVFSGEDYIGLHVLIEKRTIGENSLNLSPASADDASGSFILELPEKRGMPGVTSNYKLYSPNNSDVVYQFKYPSAENISEEQSDYISELLKNFEDVMNNNDVTTAVEDYINIESFVDYFLLNEIAKNVNGFRSQTIFYKDRDTVDKKLHIESSHEFALALGNVNYYDGWSPKGWTLDYLKTNTTAKSDTLPVPFWWPILAENPQFQKQVYARWNEFYEDNFTEEAMLDMMDELLDQLDTEENLNFERWNILGTEIEPNEYVGATYIHEFDYLFVWLMDRFIWMNNEIEAFKTADVESANIVTNFELEQNFPNPFNPTTTISYRISKPGMVKLAVYNINGQLVDILVSENQTPGSYKIDWNAGHLANGLYFYKLFTENNHQVKRMVLLK